MTDDPAPADGNVVLVPMLRFERPGRETADRPPQDLENARTIWYLAAEGNEKARRALRDEP